MSRIADSPWTPIVGLILAIVLGAGLGKTLGRHSIEKTPHTLAAPVACTRPAGIVSISWPASKYPSIKAHTEDAIAKGWPRILVLYREGDDARRKTLLRHIPSIPGDGYDRDEYPPALGRTGWLADVALVSGSENRSHGASLGAKLRPYCDGTLFVYDFS